MKRRILALVISMVMIVGCFGAIGVSAADTNQEMTFDTAYTMLNKMAEYLMEQTPENRNYLYNWVHSYMKTDLGVDALITLVDDQSSVGDNAVVNNFIASFGVTEEKKSDLKFALMLAKCIPTDARAKAFDDMKSRTEFALATTEEERAAMDAVYGAFLTAEQKEMLNNDMHKLGELVVMQFLADLNKTFVVTDAKTKATDFALYKLNSEFKTKIEKELKAKYPTVNGTKWSTAEELIGMFINSANSSAKFDDTAKANFKKVLGIKGIDMYVRTIVIAPSNSSLLSQKSDNIKEVTFNVDNDNTGLSNEEIEQIEWYVNDEKQEGATGTEFKFRPSGVGEYKIVAKLPDGTVVSNEFTVKVTERVTGGVGGSSKPNVSVENKKELEEIKAPTETGRVTKFVDIEGHWAEAYMEYLYEKGIFSGTSETTMTPDAGVTRQEIAVLLVNMLGYENEVPFGGEKYTDDEDIADWARTAVYVLTERKIYAGYGDGSFRPQTIISRQEFVSLLSRRLSGGYSKDVTYSDATDIYDWAVEDVEKLNGYGIVSGYPDNTFRPTNLITRAEAAVIIYNTMYRLGKVK